MPANIIRRTRLWLLLAVLASVPAPQADAAIKVLIVDGQNNHDWKTTTPHQMSESTM